MLVYLTTRKVRIKPNGGMQLAVPRAFLVNIKAKQGQKLSIFLDDKNQSLIVKKAKVENDRD
jgi:hypothetical protein